MKVKGKKIVLVPFNKKSILLYHSLRMMNEKNAVVEVLGFFDNNMDIDGCIYDSRFIMRPYYSNDIVVVVCTDNKETEQKIKKQLLNIGYCTENIIDYECIRDETGISQFEASDYFCEKDYLQIYKMKVRDVQDIRRMQAWNRIRNNIEGSESVNYKNLAPYNDNIHRNECIKGKNGEDYIFLYTLDIGVTDKCSLKCKNCANMMQYYEKPQDTSPQKIIDDYKRMIELLDWIDDIAIIGGEPFVHKNLDYIIKGILQCSNTEKKVGLKRIITNGTIVPNNDVLDVLSNSDIVVCISNYKNKSRNIDKLIQKLLTYNIKYVVYDMPNWRFICQLKRRETSPTIDELLEYRKFCYTRCRTFGDGAFYLCSFLKAAHRLHAIPDFDNTCVNLYDIDAKSKIAEYLNSNNPMAAGCGWCTGDPIVEANNDNLNILPALQVERPIKYQVYEYLDS